MSQNLEDSLELIESLAGTPDEIARLLSDIQLQAINIKPSADEFSPLETICHLRDIEVEGYSTRIKRILAEERPVLADIDGGRLAIERAYNDQAVYEAFDAFALARKLNVAVLREVDEEQIERAGIFEGIGNVSLHKLLLMMREHDDGHLDDLRKIANRSSARAGYGPECTAKASA